MTEVEIFWPARLPSDAALEAQKVLGDAGVQATCRLQPVRRGSENVLVLLTAVTLEPFLKTLFERIEEQVWAGLRTFVGLFFKHKPGQPAPRCVVFESAATGAQFVFTSGLPEIAFKKAIEIDPGPRPGRWMWDDDKGRWLSFEDR